MHELERILGEISNWVWGIPLLALLFGTHLFLTVRLGFIQRYLGTGIRISLRREREGTGDVSQFGALTTALAATIGTGNIVGVATAVAAGGPGAVLWMWLTGVFGIATKYAEALLSVKYRITTERGTMAGGPMYVLERGLTADFAFVKAWKGDRWGNLVYNKTARNFNPVMATAARVTIAEVEQLVDVGELDPDCIHTPAIYVKRVLQGTNYSKRIEKRTVRKAGAQ